MMGNGAYTGEVSAE